MSQFDDPRTHPLWEYLESEPWPSKVWIHAELPRTTLPVFAAWLAQHLDHTPWAHIVIDCDYSDRVASILCDIVGRERAHVVVDEEHDETSVVIETDQSAPIYTLRVHLDFFQFGMSITFDHGCRTDDDDPPDPALVLAALDAHLIPDLARIVGQFARPVRIAPEVCLHHTLWTYLRSLK